jgi:hypothetical protein
MTSHLQPSTAQGQSINQIRRKPRPVQRLFLKFSGLSASLQALAGQPRLAIISAYVHTGACIAGVTPENRSYSSNGRSEAGGICLVAETARGIVPTPKSCMYYRYLYLSISMSIRYPSLLKESLYLAVIVLISRPRPIGSWQRIISRSRYGDMVAIPVLLCPCNSIASAPVVSIAYRTAVSEWD